MPTTMKLIAKNVLGSAAANVEFTSIPATYDDLYVAISARGSIASVNLEMDMQFNGSTSNRSSRWLYGNGSSAASNSSASLLYAGLCPGANATASTFGSIEIYVPNYAASTNKSYSLTSVQESNQTLVYIIAAAGLWSNTAAITSLKIIPTDGGNFVADSSFFLYGITKA